MKNDEDEDEEEDEEEEEDEVDEVELDEDIDEDEWVEDEDDGGVGKFVSPTVCVVVAAVVVDGLSDDACWLVDVGLERNFEMLCDDGVVGVNDLTSDDTSFCYTLKYCY